LLIVPFAEIVAALPRKSHQRKRFQNALPGDASHPKDRSGAQDRRSRLTGSVRQGTPTHLRNLTAAPATWDVARR
jgi:hypothetical protein